MSLFPAYSNLEEALKTDKESTAGPSWLSNSTFDVPKTESNAAALSVSSSSSESDSKENSSISVKHRKRKKSKIRKASKKKLKDSWKDLYYEDSTPLPGGNQKKILPQVQLTKPVSNYKVPESKKNKKSKRGKKIENKNRYFTANLDEEKEKELNIDNPSPLTIEDFLKQTETFNKSLRTEPQNIKMWLDYVKLQDLGAGSFRGRAEKKLSILDKALEENPDSDKLLHQKMLITENIFPMEKVCREAKSIVSKFPKNLIGWLWILNSSQYNLSKMTAPGVLLTYEEVLEGINRAHHNPKSFLEFLLQCGLFLRQCGLWEQLWVLLELYLELNLTTAGSGEFKVDVSLPEIEIQSLEDSIITSGLPLGALWLRVERLREGVYFSSVKESSDPQRMVFKEDMSPLLFPLSSSSAASQLVIVTLLLLKVPPLPLSQAFLRYTGLQKVPSYLDSVEYVLASTFSKGDTSYLDIVPELLLGPQYLSNNIGRVEYFNFVNNIFDKCISHCEPEKVCFLVWQMRWWRWVYTFHKSNEDLGASSKKIFLGLAKKTLKQNRDVIPLYTEYALFESEAGDFDASMKVLETAINLRDPPLLTGILYKRDLCNLYRVYIDILIRKDVQLYKEKILTTLIALAFGEPVRNIILRDDLIKKCADRFKHITTEVIRDIKDHSIGFPDIMFPDTSVSWLVCHAWFLYITETVWDSISLLGNAIKELNNSEEMSEGNVLDIIQEGVYEGLLEIFTIYCQSHPGHNNKLFETAEKAFKCYPNNAFFLNTVYSCNLPGLKWSKFIEDVISFDSPLAAAIIYFMTHVRLTKEESLKATAATRLHGLLEKLKNCFERCPLFWRLLLQASSLKDPVDIKKTFYLSLEKCPWVKILYYEAAKILPGDLPEIQDLIVEKELRLHITPEELEILREGS